MSEILYFIQIFCIFVGKSATSSAFGLIVPLVRTICPPLSVQKAVSLPRNHPSIPLVFFSILQQKRQNKATRSPFSGTVGAREMCCGWSWVVLRVRSTVLRSAGSTWRSSVLYRRPWPDLPMRCSGRWRSEWRASG